MNESIPFDQITPKIARKLWVEDLRTTKEKQCPIHLHKEEKGENKFCCLGRLYQVYMKAGGKLDITKRGHSIYYDDENGGVILKLRQWVGLNDSLGRYESSSLAFHNDSDKLTFAQIADIIEKEPSGLFSQSANSDAIEPVDAK